MKIKPVIICGGNGSRLWPLSRKNSPKQFIKLEGNKSLFDLTLERVKSFKNIETPLIISNVELKFLVYSAVQKAKLRCDFIFEPIGRNTAAAVYLAAKHSNDNQNLLFLASDHYIKNDANFIKEIETKHEQLNSEDWLLFGVKPYFASTSYGYIKISNDLVINKIDNDQLIPIESFVEKPNQEISNIFYKDSSYFWNSGIFLANTKTIINSFKKLTPDTLQIIDLAWNNTFYDKDYNSYFLHADDFVNIDSVSIDVCIFEKSTNLLFSELKINWADIGSWNTFLDKISLTENKNLYQIDSKNNRIYPSDRLIATIGVEDLIIVDTSDATLIMRKDKTEKVKQIYERLSDEKRTEIFKNSVEERPWGSFKNLLTTNLTKVKRLTIHPDSAISTQYHNRRSEHWVVVSGIADITLNSKKLQLTEGNSIDIPQKAIHSAANNQDKDLIIIEVQMGEYFGEDDIIRLYDPYKRKD